MKRYLELGVLVLVVILAIGFAVVTTNLILYGISNISTNPADFDIYFTNAATDEGGSATIDSNNNKNIVFSSKKLSFVGNSTTLNYTVYNNSFQYDANVNVDFSAVNIVDGVDYSNYYSLTFTGFDPTTSEHTTFMAGKTSKDGSVTITLEQPLLKEVQIEFTLTLVPSAVERTKQAVGGNSGPSQYSIESGDLDTVGSIVKIANEEFYVIGQEDANHVKLLPKWNLKVGDVFNDNNEVIYTYQESDPGFGLQSDEMIGYKDGLEAYKGCIYIYDGDPYFSDLEKRELLPEYGPAPAYVYNEQSYLYEYINDYIQYLNSNGAHITSGRLPSISDMEAVGCDGHEYYTCEDAPSWLYQTSFLLGEADNWIDMYHVDTDGRLNYYSSGDGLRPVLILEK